MPAERNAHPHFSGGLAVVHQGIIESHWALGAQLETLGYRFNSDTETIAHLIEACRAGNWTEHEESKLFLMCIAPYALAVLSGDESDSLIVARESPPLISLVKGGVRSSGIC